MKKKFILPLGALVCFGLGYGLALSIYLPKLHSLAFRMEAISEISETQGEIASKALEELNKMTVLVMQRAQERDEAIENWRDCSEHYGSALADIRVLRRALSEREVRTDVGWRR